MCTVITAPPGASERGDVMNTRFVQLMAGALIAVGALAACRKEVPPPAPPIPKPDSPPKPTAHATALASAGGAVLFLAG